MAIVIRDLASIFDDFDRETVVLLDGQNDFKIFRGHNTSKDGVHAIEMRGGGMGDEELAATGVFAGMGHAQGAGGMLFWVTCSLTFNVMTGAAGAGHAAGTFFRVGATALNHEVVDDAVEGESIIKTVLGQFDKIGDREGGGFTEKVEVDIAAIAVDDGLWHAVVLAMFAKYSML